MQRVIAGATALIVALCLSANVNAETKPEDAIKYRQAVMATMGGHIGAFMLIAFNKVDGAPYLQSHADALANASNELVVLFPAGSDAGETEVLPAVWSDPDGFSAAVTKAQKATEGLQKAVAGGDRGAIMGAFADVGKACKGCHENYRAEDHDH
jgi:cytochrome c556